MWCVLGLVACKGRQGEVAAPTAAPPPAWVEAHPVDDAYYIGIGVAGKNTTDYQGSAKKNALNDLASEISVQVQGNSLLYTLDKRAQFRETYTNTIRTRTDEQLEGYELVDSYDNGNDYWVYYRLSRSKHAQLKSQRRQQAIDLATDLHARSHQALDRGDLRSAMDLELRALLALKEYWGEALPVDRDGDQIDLGNDLYASLQRMTADIRISTLPERCVLDQSNAFRREMLVKVAYRDGPRSTDLVQVPIVLSYPGIDGQVNERKTTDANGQVHGIVEHVAVGGVSPELVVTMDLKDLLPGDLDATLVRGLTSGSQTPSLHAPIDRVMPRVFLHADERNFGRNVGSTGCAGTLEQALTALGFRFVDDARSADLLMDLVGNTREGGSASGFFTAYLDLSVACRDRSSGEVVYQSGRQDVKGVQLNYEKAGLEAYRKAGQEMQREIIPALIGAVL